MTSGEILGTLFMAAVAAGLYLAGWIEHRRFVRWRDANRAAEEVAAE